VRRLGHGVNLRQKPLCQFVSFALGNLVGLDRHQGIVAALGLNGHRDVSDGAREFQPPILLLYRRESLAKVALGTFEDLQGCKMSSVEVFHVASGSVNRSRILVVLRIQVSDLLLPHHIPEGIFHLDLLDEEIVLWIEPGCGLGALEVEGEPLLDAAQASAL
jgi:hypothetical protein